MSPQQDFAKGFHFFLPATLRSVYSVAALNLFRHALQCNVTHPAMCQSRRCGRATDIFSPYDVSSDFGGCPFREAICNDVRLRHVSSQTQSHTHPLTYLE